jgi:hypothetical protein
MCYPFVIALYGAEATQGDTQFPGGRMVYRSLDIFGRR